MSQDEPNFYSDPVPPALPRQGTSGCMKVFLVLLVIGGVMSVVCCGGMFILGWNAFQFLKQAVSTDPVEIQKTTQEIADIPIPAGLTPQMRMDFSVARFVTYADTSKESQLVIAQIVGAKQIPNSAEAVGGFRRQQEEENGPQYDVLDTENKDVTVRGTKRSFQFVELKARDSEQKYRRVVGSFPAKQGYGEIEYQMKAEDYDEEAVIKFLESIK